MIMEMDRYNTDIFLRLNLLCVVILDLCSLVDMLAEQFCSLGLRKFRFNQELLVD